MLTNWVDNFFKYNLTFTPRGVYPNPHGVITPSFYHNTPNKYISFTYYLTVFGFLLFSNTIIIIIIIIVIC